MSEASGRMLNALAIIATSVSLVSLSIILCVRELPPEGTFFKAQLDCHLVVNLLYQFKIYNGFLYSFIYYVAIIKHYYDFKYILLLRLIRK